jgi:hypothetical protein
MNLTIQFNRMARFIKGGLRPGIFTNAFTEESCGKYVAVQIPRVGVLHIFWG